METADSPSENASPAAASGLDFAVVGIGASAGGLAAVRALLEGLPAAPDMAFVVVLHLSQHHESHAAALFQASTSMPVAQVQDPVRIERDHVYVAPPGHDLTAVDGTLVPVECERSMGRHVVIDRFFRALADAYRQRAIGIVLSGAGADGAIGIGRLKEEGGIVIAQAPDDAEYDGMPKNAIATGKVDLVLPVADIAKRLVEIRSNAARIALPGGSEVAAGVREPAEPQAAEEALRDVMKTL
ncbi:MAG TPA: chemotaxis protein CheB, partial [Caldimonas sp.]|nr:chemotaxis protein CheB [Caldimonas sp.]